MERWAGAVSEAFQTEVLPSVAGADVFIDDTMAELLHWTEAAAQLLLRAKATSVRQFSSFESPTADCLVFLLAGPLDDSAAIVLRDLLSIRPWKRVRVYLAVTPQGVALHSSPHAPEDPIALMSRWGGRLRGWAGGEVEVRPLGLVCAAILPRLWMLPNVEMMAKETGGYRDWITVDRLNTLLDTLKVREEIFAVGKAANSLATDLVNYGPAKARRKAAHPRAALLLLDRCLDLGSVAASHTDSCLDSAHRLLPSFSSSLPSDLAVSLSPLSPQPLLPPGCLADAPRPLLADAALWRLKEAPADLLKRLLVAGAEEGLEIGLERVPARITAPMLIQAVQAFARKEAALWRHAGLLQVALAAAAATGGVGGERWRVEKAVVGNAGSGQEQEEVVVGVLRREAEEGKRRSFSWEQAVGFVAFAMSVMGPDHEMKEESWSDITVSLTQLLCEEIHNRQQMEEEEQSSPLLDMIFEGKTPDIDAAPEAVCNLIRRLKAVQKCREDMRKWRELVDTSVVPRYTPLVATVAAHCCGTDRSPADLAYLSTGLKDLFKSGLSYFVQTAARHPADSDGLVLLVVLGPVTWAEYRAVLEIAESAAPRLQLALVSCGGISRGAGSLSRLLAM